MISSKDLFRERVEEIEMYFDFLQDVIDRKAKLSFSPGSQIQGPPLPPDEISIELTHTLKANGFLLLYNLVEATASIAIEEIHTEIDLASSAIGADELHEPLARRATARFKSEAIAAADLCKYPISRIILRHWLDDHKKCVDSDRHPLFTGNVDAKRLREIGTMYGFSTDTDATKTKNGGRLVEVKQKRNNLAHGQISFRECGRETAIETLVAIKTEVIFYLSEVLSNIENYIVSKQYLRAGQQPSISQVA